MWVTVAITVASHLSVADNPINEEKAPAADAVVVTPPVEIVELEIVGTAEKVEDIGEESIGPLGYIPFSYEGGGP